MAAFVICALCSSLGSDDGSFLQNTDEAKKNHARIHFMQSKILDDAIMEDEVFRRCFVLGGPKVEHPTTKSECLQALLDLCESFRKEHSKGATAACNLCGNGISTEGNRTLLDHACAHLENKLFSCRLCDCSSSSVSGVWQHLRRKHNIQPTPNDFENKIVEHFREITDRIKRCFSSKYPRASGLKRQFVVSNSCRDKRRRSVIHFCRSIFTQRSKCVRLECNLCGLRTRNRECNFNARAMYEHAAAHLDVKLFACRHCDKPMSTKNAISSHLKNSHQISDGGNDDFEDRSEKFHAEYLNMIERCFSGDQSKFEVPSVKHHKAIKAEAIVRSLTNGSKLTVERRLFHNRLIRKSIDSDGKIKCSLCSKRIGVKVGLGPFFHAEAHLQKPLYRCTLCNDPFCTKPVITEHLKRKHALGLEKNYECVADDYHEEIIAMLSKCFSALG